MLALLLLPAVAMASANHDGTSGLLETPTAEVLEVGQAEYSMGSYRTDLLPLYPGTLARFYAITIGFLPDLELTGKFNDFAEIPDQRNNVSSLLDRSISLKYRLYSSDDLSAAIGAIDIGGESQIQSSYYGVATYTGFDGWDLSAGLGTEHFEGGFAGARWSPTELVSLIGEYRDEDMNYGLELHPLKGVTLKGGILHDETTYSASYTFPLNPRGEGGLCCPVKLERCPEPYGDPCAQAAAIRDALVAESFENVVVGAGADTVYAAFESRRFKEQVDALGVAAAIVAANCGPEIEEVVLVQKTNDIPLLKLRADAESLLGFFNHPQDRHRLLIDTYSDSGYPPDMVFAEEGANKQGRGDIALRLTTSVNVNEPSRPAFRIRTGVGLEEDLFVGRGLVAQARQDWPLVNDIEEKTDPVNRDALLKYFSDIQEAAYIYGAAGYLGADRYGGKLEAAQYFSGGRYKAGITYAQEQTGNFNGNPEDQQLLGELALFVPEHDLRLAAKGGKFIRGDSGIQVEATRYFGPTSLTFFAYDTEHSAAEGGFSVFIALPWFDESRHPAWRAAGSPEFGYQYRTEAARWGTEVLPADGIERERQRMFPAYVESHLAELRRAAALHLPQYCAH